MAGERLASLIKNARPHETEMSDIVYGRVTSTSPLVVEVEGRFKIGKEHLVLSRTVQDLTLSFDVPTYSANHKNVNGESVVGSLNQGSRQISIQVFRDLRVGDKVSMIRGQKGQLYYILDRRP